MDRPAQLSIKEVSKSFDGETKALDRVSLDLPHGTLTALTGPSGSGKTTLLRIVAGLLSPDEGSIHNSSVVNQAIMVFQDNLLFPHLKVIDNVTFAPRARGVKRKLCEPLAMDLLRSLGIENKSQAWPGELSAGQQQRVALARALAAEPGVLLLDEPFANLDRGLRLETALFLRSIQQERKLTVLMVTHGQEEAFQVADTIAYLRRGRIVQVGTADDFRLYPTDLETAKFTGEVLSSKDPDSGKEIWFRASEVRISPDEGGNASIIKRFWTGTGFRFVVSFQNRHIELFSLDTTIEAGQRVKLSFTPLQFKEVP